MSRTTLSQFSPRLIEASAGSGKTHQLTNRYLALLAAGVAVLIINAVVGENGYLATVRARRQLQVLASEVAK